MPAEAIFSIIAFFEMAKNVHLHVWEMTFDLENFLLFEGANSINLWTCNLWTGQSIKQIKLNLPPQMANSFPDQIFCHLYLCHNRRNACCRWWKSYFSCSISIREISESSGEREGFSQWIVEIKDIARLLSLSVRNKWTYKKVVTINLHQIYSQYITHRSWYLKKDWTCKIACKSS